MGKSRISVVCNAFNEEAHLEETIRSVLEQSYSDFEFIVVDDGSSDGTKAVLERMAATDTRIRPFFEPHKGKVAAFNTALAAARGEWIVGIAGDDLLEKDALQTIVDAVHDIDGRVVRAAVFARIKMFATSSEYKKYDGIEIPKKESDVSRIGGGAALSQAAAVDMSPLPEAYPNEDTWMRWYYRFFLDEEIKLPNILKLYRIHAGNSMDKRASFEQFNEAYHARALVAIPFLERYKPRLLPDQIGVIKISMILENYRYSRKTFRIVLMRNVNLIDKLRAISLSSKLLYSIKVLFDRYMLGH